MSNEPSTTTDTSSEPKTYIRTYAQDFAELSGKTPALNTHGKGKAAPVAPPPPPPISPSAQSLQSETEAQLESQYENNRQSILNETFNPTRETLDLDDADSLAPQSIPTVQNNDGDRQKILARLKEKALKDAEVPSAPVTAPVVELPKVEPEPAPVPPPAPIEAPKPVEVPKPIVESAPILTKEPERFHSFSTDFADKIDKDHASTFSVLAAEKDAAPKTKPVVIEKKKGNVMIPVVLGILLIALGAGGVFATYRIVTSKNTPIPALAPSLITADSHQTIPSNTDLAGALAEQANTSVPQNTVVQDSYNSTSTPIAIPAPAVLLRNIDQLSTFGVVNANGETRAFFILHADNYERTFAGMLQWESTMHDNLAELYPLSNPPAQPASQFSDEVVSNRNTRVLKDANGNTLMIYGYANAQTLIIARNEAAFSLLISRLTAQN